MSFAFEKHPLAAGAYTLPDVAALLGLPLGKLRGWVTGVSKVGHRRYPAGILSSRESGRDRHVDFYTLIELFTVAELRTAGLSMKTLRENREELAERFSTPYPFALQGLLTDGKRLIKELGEDALLELGSGGQSSFSKVLEPFCHKIDFDSRSFLAERYFPMGKDIPIVVSPSHAFGRPVIFGTNLPTETVASLVRGGESPDDIAFGYDLPVDQVEYAWHFEKRRSA